MRFFKQIIVLALASVPLVACSSSSGGDAAIPQLLPGLEYRSGLGFSPEKATSGLDEVLQVVEDLYIESKSFSEVNFDTISGIAPTVAAVPEGDLVVSYGDITPVVALVSTPSKVNASAYGNDGVCFFLEITKSTDGQTVIYRKGADFSVTCNPLDYTKDVIWSNDESWPAADSIIMPVSETPIEQGTPLNSP